MDGQSLVRGNAKLPQNRREQKKKEEGIGWRHFINSTEKNTRILKRNNGRVAEKIT
jgi:hypothetical protein